MGVDRGPIPQTRRKGLSDTPHLDIRNRRGADVRETLEEYDDETKTRWDARMGSGVACDSLWHDSYRIVLSVAADW